jgi:hypothetical protein
MIRNLTEEEYETESLAFPVSLKAHEGFFDRMNQTSPG